MFAESATCPTLNCGTGMHTIPTVMVPTIALQGNMIGRTDANGPQGSGVNEDVCFTLNTSDRHAVAYREEDRY